MRKALSLIAVLSMLSCASGEISKADQVDNTNTFDSKFQLNATSAKTNLKLGDTAVIHILNTENIQKLGVLFKGTNLELISIEDQQITFVIPMSRFGECVVQVQAQTSEGDFGKKYIRFNILPEDAPKQISYQLIKKHPHDKTYYTQGLEWILGNIYESTGNWQHSKMIKYQLSDQKVVAEVNLPGRIFGEGSVKVGKYVYQLTWKDRIIYKYHADDLTLIQQYQSNYGEGWGLTFDGANLIMSDGSHRLYYLDTLSLQEKKVLEVFNQNGVVNNLNELEYVNGKIYSNVYFENYIVVIDPKTGAVTEQINCDELLQPKDRHANIDVFNGIAYRDDVGHFLVTGKHWPFIYEIKLNSK